jgi:hypothetical protein
MRPAKLAALMLVAALSAGLAACGGSKAAGTGSFNAQGNRTLTCMAHQSATPAPRDRPGTTEDTESVLAYLHYYTANGDKPYCDGRPATSIDRQWLALYLAGGANRSHITRALSGS